VFYTNQAFDFRQLTLQVAKLTTAVMGGSVYSKTPAQLANDTMKELGDLKASNTLSDVVEGGQGDQHIIISTEMLEALKIDCGTEAMYVARITPFLAKAFPNRVIVNSEEFQWLAPTKEVDAKFKQKPDLFVANHSYYVHKGPKITNERGQELNLERQARTEHTYAFGVPASSRELWDELVLMDCKLDFGNAGYGEHLRHLEWLGHAAGNRNGVRGCYFGFENFRLTESKNGAARCTLDGRWDGPGSMAAFQAFFKPSVWEQAITAACKYFAVKVASRDLGYQSRDCAFLGAGADGRAIAVFPAEHNAPRKGDLMALKVSLKPNRLVSEFKKLSSMSALGVDVIGLVQEGKQNRNKVKVTPEWGAYLMPSVGEPTTPEAVLTWKEHDFKALFLSLHSIHEQGYYHGDPRLANVVKVDGKFIWIDPFAMGTEGFSAAWRAHDFRVLLNSISNDVAEAQIVRAAIEAHAGDPNVPHIDALVAELMPQIAP
jgi:tRNA A-37 threonylcarbamoyl transferase component Bud32